MYSTAIMSTYLSYDPSTIVPTPKARLREGRYKQPEEKQSSITQDDGDVVEIIPVPDIPRPLTSTFTTHFDLTKGSASHVSTSMGMGKERRASMEGMDKRPKLRSSVNASVFDDNDDTDVNTEKEHQSDKSALALIQSNTSLLDYFPAFTSSFVANCVVGCVGIFIIYKVVEARSQPT